MTYQTVTTGGPYLILKQAITKYILVKHWKFADQVFIDIKELLIF